MKKKGRQSFEELNPKPGRIARVSTARTTPEEAAEQQRRYDADVETRNKALGIVGDVVKAVLGLFGASK